MESQNKAVQSVRIIRFGVLLAIGVYLSVCLRLRPSGRTASATIEVAIALVSLACMNAVFYFNRKFVRMSQALVRRRPDDAQALRRWRTGYIGIYFGSMGIALYGLVLHFLGAPVSHVVPFFFVGAALVVWFRPQIGRDGVGR